MFRCRTGDANWADIVQIYDVLFALTGSPVVAINRMLAVAEVEGAEAALGAMPVLAGDARLADTSLIGLLARNFMQGREAWRRLDMLLKWLLVWSAIPLSGDFCSVA